MPGLFFVLSLEIDMYTYTVRPIAQKVFHEFSPGRVSFDVVNAGCCTTVRIGDRVVKQFPTLKNEQMGHTMAQAWIRIMKRKHHVQRVSI